MISGDNENTSGVDIDTYNNKMAELDETDNNLDSRITKLEDKGAEANVQSDWTATSGDTLILNKPNIVKGTGTNSIIENRINGANVNIASGNYSHAEGNKTQALGQYCHAEGNGTISGADGYDNSHAEGYQTTASGKQSHAEGQLTNALGQASHSEGGYTTASGNESHAEGHQTTASGGQSHSEGYGTEAIGNQAHAEGGFTKAEGDKSHAEGLSTIASGIYSHAEGNVTQATGRQSHAEGYETIASGSAAHAEGSGCVAEQYGAHSEGANNIASGSASHAENGHWKVFDENFVLTSRGGSANRATGQASHAQGSITTAEGDYSSAAGYHTKATGFGSTSFGGCLKTEISGTFTITDNGNENDLFIINTETDVTEYIYVNDIIELVDTANSNFSYIRCVKSISATSIEIDDFMSSGTFEIYKLSPTIAIGQYSFATGCRTMAGGQNSASFGYYTYADYDNQMVAGRYNMPDDKAFIVGTGDENIPVNGFTVGWDGSISSRGSITFNGKNKINGTRLFEITYVNGNSESFYVPIVEE